MKSIFETILQVFLGIAAFVVSLLITLGISSDFSRISTAAYWIEVAAGAGLMLVIYNLIYIMDQSNRAKNTHSRYYVAFQTNRLRMNFIHENKLYDKLDQAVKDENEERYIKKCTKLIHRITSRTSYADIKGCNGLEELAALGSRLLLKKRAKKRLERLYTRISSGKVKIKEIKTENLLRDKEITLAEPEQLDYSDTALETKRNIQKVVSFVLFSVISAVFTFSLTSIPFWQAFVKNVTMFFGAAISGFASSRGKTNFKTNIYENRNTFFERRLGITDKFIDSSAE